MMKKADYILAVTLPLFLIIGIVTVGIPWFTPLDVKTVTKVSEIYEEPIFLIFHWNTDDEIQVGNLIKLDITVNELPYKQDQDLKEISIRFYEHQLNYWSFDNDISNNQILQQDRVSLKPNWAENIFESEQLLLRFIIPTDISIEYCDYNLDYSCHKISNIIHPAPYDLKNQIDTNRLVIILSLITASLSSIIVWSRLRET